MSDRLFISYRREDTSDDAQAVYAQLTMYFGVGQVFMDENVIQGSNAWPDRIRTALEIASAVIVLIGEKWLMSHDEYGRRRLDLDDDWVRKEVRTALVKKKRIYRSSLAKMPSCPQRQYCPTTSLRSPTFRLCGSVGKGG